MLVIFRRCLKAGFQPNARNASNASKMLAYNLTQAHCGVACDECVALNLTQYLALRALRCLRYAGNRPCLRVCMTCHRVIM